MHGFAPDSARFGEPGMTAGESTPLTATASPAASEGPGASPSPSAESTAETPADTQTAGEAIPEDAYPNRLTDVSKMKRM